MAASASSSKGRQQNLAPLGALLEAVGAVVRACGEQMDLALEVQDPPADPRAQDLQFGSSVALCSPQAEWEFAIMGDGAGAAALTRAVLALPQDEEPGPQDHADALGEIAGLAGRVLAANHGAPQGAAGAGAPVFLQAAGCGDFLKGRLKGAAQTLRGPGGVLIHLILVWSRG